LQATANLYPLGFLRSVNHMRPISQFWQAARAGKLPAVSIVDPDFGRCSEENPQNIQAGEAFAAKVAGQRMSSAFPAGESNRYSMTFPAAGNTLLACKRSGRRA